MLCKPTLLVVLFNTYKISLSWALLTSSIYRGGMRPTGLAKVTQLFPSFESSAEDKYNEKWSWEHLGDADNSSLNGRRGGRALASHSMSMLLP